MTKKKEIKNKSRGKIRVPNNKLAILFAKGRLKKKGLWLLRYPQFFT